MGGEGGGWKGTREIERAGEERGVVVGGGGGNVTRLQ